VIEVELVEEGDRFLEGDVVVGFSRGSAKLGVPTANVEMTEENKRKCSKLVPGVYAAIAMLKGEVYAAAVSIGWNPVFDNEAQTVEAYLLHDFGQAKFYGDNLNLELVSFIRPEALFPSLDNLILAIKCDILTVVDVVEEKL
jgi:FAD synthase